MRNEAVIILSPHADVRASLTRLLEEAGYSTQGTQPPAGIVITTQAPPEPAQPGTEAQAEAGTSGPPGTGLPPLEEIERLYIEKVVHETGFNVSRAARILEIDRTTLYNKLRRYGLTRDSAVA
jgi:DNA-binding NtrC family response regulator